ncbi:PREDICTED: protein SMAX1-LIKE 8-like [Ipomoea nil]|uniref:protein SMAX1-LIKE 8-like n=1 Tax=Ipomoea nil TaxID=35883 RepID=UPI000900F979|nr:PREDICTED: protein SMAX1-LIKE 8-like [Ipomoea nil]
MPTPVATARQCLTAEAVRALDEAVAAARRRGHAQTTSVHMVSSLLSLPSSSALREACCRARNNAYSTRLQFKALELCLGVTLDRLPSSPNRAGEDEPPVSNSLMAAIKRSQANQRRQPENFSFYQQQQQSSCSSAPVVKVELQNMILSILDDPAVSRVFGEAGFRSCDIKIAILRPVHQFFRYSRYKGPPPLFLCNLSGDSELGRKGFTFPFLGVSDGGGGDQNCRRISEVFLKPNQKNPMLVGVCAHEALRTFLETLQTRRDGSGLIPSHLSGLTVICIEPELSGYVNGDYDEDKLRLKLEEVTRMVEQCIGPGVVLNFGDLKVLAGDEPSGESLQPVIRGLARLIEVCAGKLWVIGAVARYEVYLKVLNRFPSIEKDWDLQLLTITSPGPFPGESYPKSSLMESFVPFGGLFADMKSPLSSSYPSVSRCCLCSEKCRQEINAVSSGGFGSSVADHYQQSSLPSWLQSSNKMEVMKAKDDDYNVVLNAKIAGLQRKWDSLCQRLHYEPFSRTSSGAQLDSRVPSIVGFRVVEDGNKDRVVPSNASKESSPLGVLSDELPLSLSSSSTCSNSPTSVTSVTMDLGLHICSNSPSNISRNAQFNPKDFKVLYEALAERVWWQEEAVKVISQRIAQCRHPRATRGDVWFHFSGPDSVGKKKLVVSLSEILHGSTHSLICVDLSFEEGTRACIKSLFDLQFVNKYDVKLRGKNVVDYIAEKLGEKPVSVIFLENVEKADLLVQNSLSRAVKTGKFSDSHGREISTSNAIFVTTSGSPEGYSEEQILAVKGWPIHIQIGVDLGDDNPNKRKTIDTVENEDRFAIPEIAKRAHRASNPSLDLNLPAADNDRTEEPDTGPWLEEFLRQVDETVTFEPFGLGSLAEKTVKEIEHCFHKIIGPECLLEIESKVMEQILAAACLTNNKKVEDWIQSVLVRGFVEAQEKYSLTAHSVVKLVTSRFAEEHKPGIVLPGKIRMN